MSEAASGEDAGAGPLAGLRVVEFAGIGPGPFCAMLFADMGADVLRIERPGGTGWPRTAHDRGRTSLELDLATSAGRGRCLAMLDHADVLIEGFRPGVMERLGLGPDVVSQRNERLVYGRITGWGQEGPLAETAGHDINYIALAGALSAIGRPGAPAQVPLNLVGDFGGGAMFLAFGIVAALWERERSGKGQVVDAAIVDGVAAMMQFFASLAESGFNSLDRSSNLFGGNAPFYATYLCRDGREISVGALEPRFFAVLIDRLDLPEFADGQDPARWDALRPALAERFATRDRDEWAALFAGSDACVAPVLDLDEAKRHPQLRDGAAPRLSRTPGRQQLCEGSVTARADSSSWANLLDVL